MKIIIAGGGKVGRTLARQLASEGHDLTLIDRNNGILQTAVERYDAIAIAGNCASKDLLLQAGVGSADLLIAATNADEVNLLCCMTGHGLNPKLHTIARIRNPEYTEQIMTMQEVFPVSMTVNPERQAALEIERLLKFPGFLRRDYFAKGRTQIVELRVDSKSKLCNVSLSDLSGIVKCKVLVCAVLRAGTAVAPSGNFVLREGDRIFVTAPTADLTVLLKNLGIITRKVRKVMLCGGGRVSYYLASLLEKDGISVQILEMEYSRCVELAQLLPRTAVIHDDCSSQSVLEDQGISECDALVTLTGVDEINMVVSLYGGSRGVPQIITKLSRGENSSIADSMALGSIICPRELCCNNIVRYVRAMQNQTGAAVSVHSIADGQAEAVEFLVDETTQNCNIPLKQMKLKPNVLVVSITHGAQTQIPNGDSVFAVGDTVVIVTSGRGVLQQMNDIFA
ncbi:MAG: Trk system potassium transporter TrkA [Oscillospiraceae bacterium]|nr:Trk system potassium transporter TrkA [Oscillospiraceae bacterium]